MNVVSLLWTNTTPGQVHLVDSGTVPIPARQADGSLTTVPAGQLFPLTATKDWYTTDQLLNGYAAVSNVFDPTDLVSFRVQLKQYALNDYLTRDQFIAQIPDGCSYLWELFVQENIFQEPDEPVICTSRPAVRKSGGTFWTAGPPTWYYLGDFITTGGALPDIYQIRRKSVSICDPKTFAMVWSSLLGPPPAVDARIGAMPGSLLFVCIGYNCPGPGPPWSKPTKVPTQEAPKIDNRVPVPKVPTTCPPPVLVGGVVQTEGPGVPVGVTIAPGKLGTQVISVALPNCACKDGKTPLFAIGKITHDSSKPVSVTITKDVLPDSYLLNFNLPNTVPAFAPIKLTLPIIDPTTGEDKLTPVTLYAPSDGTNDSVGFLGTILEQILELRTSLKPQTSVKPRKIASSE